MSSDITIASITAWENMWSAWRNAARGKRGHTPAAAFEHHLADRLIALAREVQTGTYRPGNYTHFYIHEPKRRKISAAPFRDRVVHHALCNLIEPAFDRRFIETSYANRIGKGTHRAVDQLQHFSQRYRYVLRADVVKHFPSLDHAILIDSIATVIHDPDVMALVETIIASGTGILDDEYQMVWFPDDDLFTPARPRGLPIGNLTSQFWSNVYMNPFDWFVQRELRCPAYLRYVDDFALFSDSREQLHEWKAAIIARLARLRLTIHETQCQPAPCSSGIPWLGFIVYPTHRKLKTRNAIDFRRRLEHNIDLYHEGLISFAELDASVKGWVNHVRYADTWRLRTHIFDTHPIRLRPPVQRPSLPKRQRLYWKKRKKRWVAAPQARRPRLATPAGREKDQRSEKRSEIRDSY